MALSDYITYTFDRVVGNILPKDTWKVEIVKLALKKKKSVFWIREDGEEDKMYKLVPEEV